MIATEQLRLYLDSLPREEFSGRSEQQQLDLALHEAHVSAIVRIRAAIDALPEHNNDWYDRALFDVFAILEAEEQG